MRSHRMLFSDWSRLYVCVAMCALFTLVGCGGHSDEAPEDVEPDVPDTTQDVDTGEVEDDVPPAFTGPCPGVRRAGSSACELVAFGSGECTESNESTCSDLSVAISCLDEDSDSYNDEVPDNAIYVDINVAVGKGKGTIFEPFGKLADAVAAARDGDTIVVVAATYSESVLVEGKPGLTMLGPGLCQGQRVRLESPNAGGVALTIRDSPGFRLAGFTLAAGGGGLLIEGDSTGAIVEDVEFAAAGGRAIRADGEGAAGLRIRRTLARNSTGLCAIQLEGVPNAELEQVEVRDSVASGICVRDAANFKSNRLTVRGSGGPGLVLQQTEADIDRASFVGNRGGGALAISEQRAVALRGCRFASNERVGLLFSGPAAHQGEDIFVRDTVANGLAGRHHAVVFDAPQPGAGLRHARLVSHTAPPIALYGPATGIPSPAPPKAGDASVHLEEIAISGASTAGVYTRGVVGLLLSHLLIEEISEGQGGDGVSAVSSSMWINAIEVSDVARYGLAFSDTKAIIDGAKLEVPTPNGIVCELGVCNTLSVRDSNATARGNGEGLPLILAPIRASDVVPPL